MANQLIEVSTLTTQQHDFQIAYNFYPKLEMGKGPWNEEPDYIQFQHVGLPCLIVRSSLFGALCGYVGVPPGHPLHSADYSDEKLRDAPSHGGLTYSSVCGDLICHMPQPGELEPTWWFGFDCNHSCDLAPKYSLSQYGRWLTCQAYRNIEYVKTQCQELAEWLVQINSR